eukprot:gene9639-10626_t
MASPSSSVDVETLFKTQSIDEIKDAEKNLRGEIEKKKEDLRMMVGEGYRDLINAADTINEMKDLSEKVHKGIKSMQKCCHQFRKQTSKRKRTTSEDIKLGNKEINFYALATQMELLVDTPEKIWDALDKSQHLTATQLYLLGHHIVNTCLPINAGYENQGDVFASFPVLHHQWAAISHFKDSILKASTAALKDIALPDQMLAESLCSIMLLEDSSARQVFMEFLLARKAAIQDIFHANQHKASIKKQVCDITSIILLTLQQIYNLFYCVDTSVAFEKIETKALLYRIIHDVTKKKKADQGNSLQWFFGEDFDVLTVARHLPAIVLGFRPKLKSAVMAVPLQTIQNNTKEWLTGCIADVHEGVEKLLVYIKSVKGLASIRDSVYDLLKNSRLFGTEDSTNVPVDNDNTIEQPKNWNDLCELVLSRSFTIWDEFFESLFLNRSKVILETVFTNSCESVIKSIIETTDKLEDTLNNVDSEMKWDRDMTSFLWQDMPGDLPSSGWGMETNPDDSLEISTLTLKSQGCTVAVKRLCNSFNAELGEILQDAKYLIEEAEKPENQSKTKKELQRLIFEEDAQIEPFKKFSNSSETRTFLQESSLQLVNNICCHVQQRLEELERKLMNDEDHRDEELSSLLLDRVTEFGRICTAIPRYCSSLKCLARGSQDEVKSTFSQKGSKYSQRKLKQVESASKYIDITNLFSTQSKLSFRIWEEWIVSKFSSFLDMILKSPEQLRVFGTTCWEDVSIEEEGDGGKKLQSKIRVPAQVSSFLISLLFRLSEEINRIGGHVLERSRVKQLVLKIGNSIFDRYQDHLSNADSKIGQNCALQFMFDIKFVTLLLGGNSDSTDKIIGAFKNKGTVLVEKLESFVDPFDLDVFTPHMTNFVNRQLQRSWLMLGTLSNLDSHSLPTLASRSSSLSQEQHNVVPLVSNPVRFMLLPISMQSHERDSQSATTEGFQLKSCDKEKSERSSLKSSLFKHLDFYNLDFLSSS